MRAVIRLAPDLVLVTGDLFDCGEPPPGAVATLVRGIRSLGRALPRTPILVLAGPRDTPITPGDPGPLAVLEPLPRVEVATGTVRSVHLREAGIHVLLVPHAALRDRPFPTLNPDPEARWNVLAVHGRPGGGGESLQVDPASWDWVALGGEHRGREVAPRVATAGSLERVSMDPWRETGEERGFLTVDLAAGVVRRHSLQGRPVVEVAPLRRGHQELPRLNARLRGAVEAIPGGVDGKRVRIRIHGIPAEERSALDGAFLSVLRRRAAHLQLLLRSGDDGGGFSVASLPAGRGIRGLVGGTERQREEVLSAWRRDAPDGLPGSPGPDDGPETADELLLWRGRGPGDAMAFLEMGADLLARLRPGTDAVGFPPAVPSTGATAPPTEGAPGADELLRAEEEVLALRADSVEVDGEVEALTVEWLRERQDAETQLQTHRDRARELRDRIRGMQSAGRDAPCPVCGRPLSDHLGGVLEDFQEEWEALVQDGRWWRRRLDQLEARPEALRALESRGIRLHAELEAASERLEALRSRGPGSGEVPAVGGAVTQKGSPPVPDGGGAGGHAWARNELIQRGSDLLNRLCEGRVSGLLERPAGVYLVVDGSVLMVESEGEAAAVRFALHLALVELALEAGVTPALLRVGGVLTRLDSGQAGRAILLLSHLSRALPGVVANVPPALPGRFPELFAAFVELRPGDDPTGFPRLILRPGGAARIRLVGGRASAE